MKAIDKLRKYLPQFEWKQETPTSSIFGVITAPTVGRRINGTSYLLDNVYIFISSKMGGTELSGKPFRYAMCYQSGKARAYRHKNWHGVEYNKLFVSDKDLNSIVDKLIKEVDLTRYFLPK
jgi:hypothetical protein